MIIIRVYASKNLSLCGVWDKSSKNQDVGKLRKRAFVRVITTSTEISRCNVAQI